MQAQNKQQMNAPFTGNTTRNDGSLPTTISRNNNAIITDLNNDSLINSTMTYNADIPHRDCVSLTAICLLYFTGKCDGMLCFGPYCAYHHQLTTMRQMIGMTNAGVNTTRLVTVSQTQMHGRFMHLITSAIPLNKPLSFFDAWCRDVANIPHEERSDIAKFFTIICNKESACNSNTDYALLKQYLNEVTAHYFNVIRSHQHRIESLKIPFNVSSDQRNELLLSSEWFKRIDADSNIEKIECPGKNEDEKVYLYYIPFNLFNAFDRLMFMTYNLEPALNEEGYLPNCELTNTNIVHGTNYGIYNSVESYNAVNKNFNYTPDLNVAVNQQVPARIRNLDPISLFCVSDSTKMTTYIDLPVAHLKKDTCAKFDLNGIRSLSLFKYI